MGVAIIIIIMIIITITIIIVIISITIILIDGSLVNGWVSLQIITSHLLTDSCSIMINLDDNDDDAHDNDVDYNGGDDDYGLIMTSHLLTGTCPSQRSCHILPKGTI